jgi:hypothetical protein
MATYSLLKGIQTVRIDAANMVQGFSPRMLSHLRLQRLIFILRLHEYSSYLRW